MQSTLRRPANNPSTATSTTSRLDRKDTAKAATTHTETSEEMSEPPRRSKRAHPLGDVDIKQMQEANEEAIEEDEEVTRCICGQEEYPGLPLSEAFDSAEAQSEDAGGLFIQCDGCSVWQHGGCVGIVDESQSPDKYYCELCRPKQHEVHVDANGQRYSLYLPITSKLTRKSSMSKGSDKAKLDRSDTVSRASADPMTGKRRGTIRSREHDEEAEQIQRAIEESAREAQGGKRGGKRSREESSDDVKQEVKRQRRVSESIPLLARVGTADEDSDDDENTSSKVKKARAEAAQSARQAEQREKEEEREKARAEAAGRRRERAGRRRAEEESEDTPNDNGTGSNSPPPSSQAGSPPPEKSLQRKVPGKKVKKLGNNQYTKSREAPASSPHNRKRLLTSGGTSSGDEQAPSSDMVSGPPSTQEGITNGFVAKGRWGKKKALNGMAFRNITSEPMERTIPNMARNLEGMMAFIQRAQLDVAEDRARSGANDSPPMGSPPSELIGDSKSAMELADQLTRGIRDWQDKFRAHESVRA